MVPTQSNVYNPATGVFGTGQVQIFATSGTWTVPAGIGKVRVRCFGGGGYNGGSGGGFTLKAIYDLSGVSSVAVTVGGPGGTSSFGTYCYATGGADAGGAAGSGSGGDINYTGGTGYSGQGGGGVANIFGTGGNGSAAAGYSGASGGGTGSSGNWTGGCGMMGTGASGWGTYASPQSATTGMSGGFSIDYIGTGGGGSYINSGANGGGGGYSGAGGYPGGGGGYLNNGAAGMVIVEF